MEISILEIGEIFSGNIFWGGNMFFLRFCFGHTVFFDNEKTLKKRTKKSSKFGLLNSEVFYFFENRETFAENAPKIYLNSFFLKLEDFLKRETCSDRTHRELS